MLIRTQYEQLVYTLPTRYPSIRFSTLVLAPPSLPLFPTISTARRISSTIASLHQG